MPATIIIKQDSPLTGARRTAPAFLRYRIADIILVGWAVTVLLIAAHAGFHPNAAFPSDFDVSIAPF
jgi:hypothetical protein